MSVAYCCLLFTLAKFALFWVGLSLCHCFFASSVTPQNVSLKLSGWIMKVLMNAKFYIRFLSGETELYK